MASRWAGAACGRGGLFAGHFHAGCAGQFLDGLGEVQIVVVHDEAQGVAAGAAAEAVVELLVGADREGGGFLLVERAAGGVVLAGFFQLDARTHHVDDVEAVDQVVNEALGNQPGHGSLVIWQLASLIAHAPNGASVAWGSARECARRRPLRARQSDVHVWSYNKEDQL